MVAYRHVLLSTAVLATFGVEKASGGAVLGRYDRRLIPRGDGSSSSSSAAATTKPGLAPLPRPGGPATLAASPGQGTVVSIDLGASHPSSSTVVGGGGVFQLAPSSTTSSSTSTDYIDPNDYSSTGGALTTRITSVPTRTTAPSRPTVVVSAESKGAPPPGEQSASSSSVSSSSSLTSSFTTSPLRLPTYQVNSPPLIIGGPAIIVGSATSSASTISNASTPSATTSPPLAAVTQPPGVPGRTKTVGGASSTQTYKSGTTESFDLGQGSVTTGPPMPTSKPSLQSSASSASSYGNMTGSTPIDTNTISYCQASDSDKPKTSYIVTWSYTVTWTGDPAAYVPPFPPLTTPPTCVDVMSPARMTYSYCGEKTCTTELQWIPVTQTKDSVKHATVTFITTDKNPTVVFPTVTTPDYGVPSAGGKTLDVHNSMVDPQPIVTPGYDDTATKAAVEASPTKSHSPVTVVPQPTGVIINDKTITDNPAVPTQTVVVGQDTFTVDPTKVVGGGVTVDRISMIGGVFAPTPTSTNIGGVDVAITSSVAVLDGTTFTLGQTPITTSIKGQAVTLGPGGVVVGTATVPVSTVPPATQIIIAGGELITASGQSVLVIQGTTITYGPSSSGITVVGGDSVTYGPSGVTVHGTTLGGAGAKSGDTAYEIVGGATITEVGPSLVVIDGTTYTVGPGTGTTTTVIKGQTITIEPSGVVVSTLTLHYPFGPTTVITPGATPTPTTVPATGVTDIAPTPSKDAAVVGLARPGIGYVLCIALGVVVWGM